jgi:hypothetical protein
MDDDSSVMSNASRVSGCHASGSPIGVFELIKEKKQNSDCGDVEDSTNVDDLSELLTHIENEEDAGVDFSVFIEDEDALNVEEISDVFTALEDVDSLPTEDEVQDAENVDDVSELFSYLEEAGSVEVENAAASVDDVCDAANVDSLSDLFSALEDSSCEERSDDDQAQDEEDAGNVDCMADVFSELAAESEEDARFTMASDVSSEKATPEWIDSLEVDNMSSLFSELERKEAPIRTQQRSAQVDSRIFVPQFSVRIEGRPAAVVSSSRLTEPTPLFARASGASSSPLLAGPPSVFLAGPPQLFGASGLSREDRVERWKEKRKTRSFVSKETDPSISDTRRACAAKRQRVKGRFTSEKSAFVSITALQN